MLEEVSVFCSALQELSIIMENVSKIEGVAVILVLMDKFMTTSLENVFVKHPKLGFGVSALMFQ